MREPELANLRSLIAGDDLINVAPCALNPIMARIAVDAGFKAVYMSGGSLGWLKCVTEANITLPEMIAEVAVDTPARCAGCRSSLDAGGGWGDPMHVHRTIAQAWSRSGGLRRDRRDRGPAACCAASSITSASTTWSTTELMVDKVKEAVAARTDPDLVIIARTNARRVHDLDEALRRCEAFHRAGADMLFIHTRNAEEMRFVAERLPAPLMTFAPPDGFSTFALSRAEMFKLGYRIAGLVRFSSRRSPRCTRRCGNPWSASRRIAWTRSWGRAAPRPR